MTTTTSTLASNTGLDALCADTENCLQALARVLTRLDEAAYSTPLVACPSGIGSHVRHVLDHFDAFLNGLSGTHIDYDDRKRDPLTATDRATALARIEAVTASVRALASNRTADDVVHVCMDCGCGGRTPAVSSVARELQFLVSHTVHHDALIAIAVRSLGVDIDTEFGIAPSTIKADSSLSPG